MSFNIRKLLFFEEHEGIILKNVNHLKQGYSSELQLNITNIYFTWNKIHVNWNKLNY